MTEQSLEAEGECPRCGAQVRGVTITGPHTHILSPCGCHVTGTTTDSW